MTRVMFRNVGAKRPSFSSPRPCLTTLARHCPQTTSETEAGLNPSHSPSASASSASSSGKGIVSVGSSEGSVLAARASNFTNEQIFFWPMPGVLESSENGISSRSSRVRPRKASGNRRSVGKAQ